MGHIAVSRGADAIVVAPATADFLHKLAHGAADDLLSTLRLARECPLFVAPAIALYVIFLIVPVVQAVHYSVYSWTGLGDLTDFIGLDNYREAFGDHFFRQAMSHNAILAALSIGLQLPLALGVALLLNRPLRGRRIFRLVFFAPYVLSEAITAVLFLQILQPHKRHHHPREQIIMQERGHAADEQPLPALLVFLAVLAGLPGFQERRPEGLAPHHLPLRLRLPVPLGLGVVEGVGQARAAGAGSAAADHDHHPTPRLHLRQRRHARLE